MASNHGAGLHEPHKLSFRTGTLSLGNSEMLKDFTQEVTEFGSAF